MSTTPVHPTPVTGPPGPAPRRTGSRTTVRVLLVALAVLLVAWSALTLVSLLARDTVRTSDRFAGVRSLDLDLDFESVTVTGSDTARDVRLERSTTWSMRKPSTGARLVGDRLVVSSRCGWDAGIGCSGSVRLVVPAGTDLLVRGADGHLTMRGLTGDVDARQGDGAIDASGLTGRLRLATNDGSITGTDLTVRTVTAQAGDGRIRLDFATAPESVTARTADGSVEVAVPRDGGPWRVDARTGDGSRTVDVGTDPGAARSIEVHTGDGSVIVRYAD